MGEVIDFDRGVDDRTVTHASGEAVCQHCGHEWVAVVPVGTVDLECSQCGTQHGVFKGPCVPESTRYVCRCGCDVFSIIPDGPLCRYCGLTHSWEAI